jgi:hypothetical protein
MNPNQVQSWFFCDDDLTTLDPLAVQRIDVGAGESGHDPETRCHRF